MNMLEEYLNFEKNNITQFAKEILSEKFDENFFNPLLKVYIENRYYNYYNENDLTFDDNIMSRLEKTFINMTKGFNKEEKSKVIDNYLVFNFILYYDGVSFLKEPIFYSLLRKYRMKLFNLDDKLFQENITKFIYNANKRREKFYKIFETKDFYLKQVPTNIENVIDIVLGYNIEFPKLYSEYAIDRVFESTSINEEKMFVEYQLVTLNILKDIRNCNFDKNYLIEFATSLFENKEGLKDLLNGFSNDCFKNQSVFKIKYEDYCKYGNDIKEMIKDGYLFAIMLNDEEEIDDLIIFNIFKYIIVSNDSKYCTNKEINDKIIIV